MTTELCHCIVLGTLVPMPCPCRLLVPTRLPTTASPAEPTTAAPSPITPRPTFVTEVGFELLSVLSVLGFALGIIFTVYLYGRFCKRAENGGGVTAVSAV